MSAMKIAVICSSNMNRSMEAHAFLAKNKFDVKSYGSGDKVKIPGRSAKEPNCYPFGTCYGDIYDDLVAKDKQLYTENGMLHILDRNRRIKERPERFQSADEKFDLILTCEEKVYDSVIATFETLESVHGQPVHVINMDIVDNPDDATIGAFLFCELVQLMTSSHDLDDDMDELLQDFESKCKRSILHTVCFY